MTNASEKYEKEPPTAVTTMYHLMGESVIMSEVNLFVALIIHNNYLNKAITCGCRLPSEKID